MVQIIRIAERDPLGLDLQCPAQPGGAGGTHPALGLVDDGKPRIPGGHIVAQQRRFVPGAIVHQHAAKVVKLLGRDGVQAIRQIFGRVVYGHDHRNGADRGAHRVTSA